MDWTPPATTTSAVPDMTAWAAKCTACWPEPHWRSTVVPGTSSGRPAASQQVRATSPAWGPMVSTQPNTTSSTPEGSIPDRSTSAFNATAPRSAGWSDDSPPPRRPTGVRTASTMYASVNGALLPLDDDGRAVPEQALVGGDAEPGALDLAALGPTLELPHELAHLGDGLGGDGLAEAREPSARVHRDPAADGGVAVVEQALGLTLLAQPDVLVPVELEGRGEVVDLGHVHVVRPDTGLLVGGGGDRVAEGHGRHGGGHR